MPFGEESGSSHGIIKAGIFCEGFKLGDKAKSDDDSRVNLIKSCDDFLRDLCLLCILCVKQYQQILFVEELIFGCKCPT